MANFAYAVPYMPPEIVYPAWSGMVMKWVGWDGSEWTISDLSQGVVLLSGVRGLNMPPTKRHTSTSPGLHGSRRRGWITDEREVFWPVKVFNDGGSDEWLAHERAFWRTMHPDKPGAWSVTQPSGETRTLTCVYDNDGGQEFDVIPSLTGWMNYGIYLAAEQPFWAGETISGAWAASAPVDFFGGASKGPAFNISSGSTFAQASLTNPGDVETWPVYTIVGPCTAANVGGVSVPFAIPAGKAVRIDTAPGPLSQTALYGDWVGGQVVNTVDRTRDLGTINFAPVPAGGEKPLSISMTGAGQIIAEITPLYFRAW